MTLRELIGYMREIKGYHLTHVIVTPDVTLTLLTVDLRGILGVGVIKDGLVLRRLLVTELLTMMMTMMMDPSVPPHPQSQAQYCHECPHDVFSL